MIILLYGENNLQKNRYLCEVRGRFTQKFDPSGMNRVEFPHRSMDALPLADITQAINTPPFLGEKRLTIVQNLFDLVKADELDAWLGIFRDVPESSIVVIVLSQGVKDVERRTFFKKLKSLQDVHLYPFPSMDEEKRRVFFEREAMRLGVRLTQTMWHTLLHSAMMDGEVLHELQKLSAYSKTAELTQGAFDVLVESMPEEALFPFLDAVSEKKTDRALIFLEEQRKSGGNDFILFSLLLRQIRLLLAATLPPRESESAFAGEMGVSPFVARKAVQQSRIFTPSSLSHLHELAFSLDSAVKSGQIEMKEAVNRLVLAICA